ncbi:MAG: hypothetical protein PUH25_05240 [Spirochaetales bacterium]|nr:hypothetical protein [Bullifex sp.]MDD7271269.1 hypothetical protein [Spirochaetales bacterium]MDY4068184.1 hypothetical protein [Bullifex sp.]
MMLETILEIILWSLKICTSVIELISAIKKSSRPTGHNRKRD